MTIEINEFWNLLSKSKLLLEQKIQSLRSQFSSIKQNRSANGLAKWLVDQKAISTYQATIILAGHYGPFQYGNYTLVDRFDKGHLDRTFRAVHSRTLYPVLLEFFAGNCPDDLKKWQQAESITDKVSPIEHPNLIAIYESVALDDHRFVVGQLPAGVPLLQALTPKGRLPWKSACLLAAQVSRGLQQLHSSNIVHGSISPNCIWLQKNGFAQLKMSLPSHSIADVSSDPNQTVEYDYQPTERAGGTSPSTAGDIFALGCILYRVISGRTPWDSKTSEEGKKNQKRPLSGEALIASLAKYELPTALESTIGQLLATDRTHRTIDLNQLSDQLAQFSGKKKLIDSFSVAKTHSMAAYRQALNQFKPGSEQLVERVPVIDTEEGMTVSPVCIPSSVASPTLSADRAEKISAATSAAQRRRKSRWKMPAAVAGTLLLFAVAIGVWAMLANRKIVRSPEIPATQANTIPKPDASDADVTTTPILDLAEMLPSQRPILLQDLVAEDSESLWESPTNGPPIDFSGVPLAPKLIFVFRPEEIVSQPEGQRVLQSLGPEFNSLVDRWETECGMALAEVSQLIVSLHNTPNFDYEPFFVITPSQPWEFDELLRLWNRPQPMTAENGQPFFAAAKSEMAYYVFSPRNSDESLIGSDEIPAPISRFAFGSRTAIEEVANNPEANRLAGSLRKTGTWADHDRHLNVLFLRNALFNDEGQQLMGPELQSVNRELAIMIPDSVRGGLFSLHLDGATFLELMFDRNVDIQPEDLITSLTGQLRSGREKLTQFVARIPPSTYWDKVRQKYDNMLSDLFRNLRWDVEHGEVAANCWLPPMAAHNLAAASELVISFSKGDSGTVQSAAPLGPQTIEQLLAAKRDLVLANPPDLNVLMSAIEAEVNDDNRDLPFRFHIRLLGSDLEQKGITKNQRPGELDIRQTPLSKILTEIMVAANPSQDITGPADPNCQLIWVIAEDPESAGEKAVLITTRAAATEKSYRLPSAFEIK